MNLISGGPMIRIALSRRNLNTLIRMLDMQVGEPVLRRRVADDVALFITAEEDEQHYASEARQSEVRGVMGVGPEDIPDYIHP